MTVNIRVQERNATCRMVTSAFDTLFRKCHLKLSIVPIKMAA